ncbi:hypothetical protein [Draconibacterium halophilum]|uniref:Uncharacterized protein n=1 Tax=Draconibacterium halophilum TaxID=2706887 RepID=A0A6C0RAJ9_9BACT|nr:hypothetical protein [Draconibacterium halophilum]QIA07119.1 hypothetical protein G0Q07_04970 [Draconibacterium halophilum]
MKYTTEEEIERNIVLLYQVPERVKTIEDYEIPEMLLYIENAILDVMNFGIDKSMFVKEWWEDQAIREGGRSKMEKFEIDALKSVEQTIIQYRDRFEPDVNDCPSSIEDIKELNTPEAKVIFDKAIDAGLISEDNGYKWTGVSKQQLAYFVEKTSLHLGLRKSRLDEHGNPTIDWKIFEKLFKKNRIQSAKSSYMKSRDDFEPPGHEVVDVLFG